VKILFEYEHLPAMAGQAEHKKSEGEKGKGERGLICLNR
jgi:hypothetical protein